MSGSSPSHRCSEGPSRSWPPVLVGRSGSTSVGAAGFLPALGLSALLVAQLDAKGHGVEEGAGRG